MVSENEGEAVNLLETTVRLISMLIAILIFFMALMGLMVLHDFFTDATTVGQLKIMNKHLDDVVEKIKEKP